jgi:hypothetical protein
MTLRCKDGDLAIIIRETPECADNFGRVVEVKGPPRWGIGYQLVSWRIRPVHPTPLVVDDQGVITREIVDWASQVIHPDTWLLPIKKSGESRRDEIDRKFREAFGGSNVS